MITRETMIEPVLTASPGFRPVWSTILAEWDESQEDLPIYLALSELARPQWAGRRAISALNCSHGEGGIRTLGRAFNPTTV